VDSQISTMRELIDAMAEIRPNAVFLISPETTDELTFRELQEQSNYLSTQIRQAGAEQGDKVAFLLDNGLFTAQLLLGVMYGGFVAVPLNPGAGVSQLTYMLDHCDAKLLYVADQYGPMVRELINDIPRAVQVIAVDPDKIAVRSEAPLSSLLSVSPEPQQEALLLYSSGSTSRPKASRHSHGTLLSAAGNCAYAHRLSAADRSLLVLPLYHVNAQVVTLLPSLMSGASVVLPHRFSISHFWEWLDYYGCTWSALVPTIISQLLDWREPGLDRHDARLQQIRFFRSSSAPLSPSLHREFNERFRLPLIQAMGSTEAGNVFCNPLGPSENKIGSAGLPTGFEVKIIDREGSEVQPGHPGEILIRGPALALGYYKEPQETAAAFDQDGWFHTGDLAYRDKDGYIFAVGRSKELIIKGGVNIAPRQIDEVLESHPAVLEAAVVGVSDRHLGEDLVAFVVLRAGMVTDEKELLRFCTRRLGDFKTPQRIVFVADLPKGPSGKVQRLRLLDPALNQASDSPGFIDSTIVTGHQTARPPSRVSFAEIQPIEQVISQTWAEVLVLPHIGLKENFFTLGGHSLLAIQCLSLLRERLPVTLSLSDFFENGTVSQQGVIIRQRMCARDPAGTLASTHQSAVFCPDSFLPAAAPAVRQTISSRDRESSHPLSPAQQRIRFLEQLNPDTPVYNEVEGVRLRGALNVEALEQALNHIVMRHEALRTTIEGSDVEPLAIVHENWPLQLKKVDLNHLDSDKREAEVERLLIDEPRRLYHLDLEPGIRATLLRLGIEEHVFMLLVHHVICDRWSLGVLWRELARLYGAFRYGEKTILPPVPIQQGDYAAWQQQQNSKLMFDEDLAFWQDKLRGAPELLELPTDRRRLQSMSCRGARRRFQLNPIITEALRDFSRQAKTSLFVVFATALNILLSRYAGSEDVLIGISIADRDQRELESVIGLLIHTHVLRTQVSGIMTFRKLVSHVQHGLLEVYDHRAVSFDRVVRAVLSNRNPSYSPIFQVNLNWRDRDQQLAFIGLEGLAVESLLSESGTSKFDLTLTLTDGAKEIWLEIEYSTDLFNEDRMRRMVGHYQALLEAAVENPHQPVGRIDLLTAEERQRILVLWNGKDHPLEQACLAQLFEEQVELTPDAVAVVFEDQQLSYRELNRRSNLVAHRLIRLGVGPESLVGIAIDRSATSIVALLGIVKAGGAYVPIDLDMPAQRLERLIADAKLRYVFSRDDAREQFCDLKVKILAVDDPTEPVEAEDSKNPLSRIHPLSAAYINYTSGTTGEPKGVLIPHGAVVRLVREPNFALLDSATRLLHVSPLNFDAATFEIWGALLNGGVLVVAPAESKSASEIEKVLQRHGVNTLWLTAALFHQMVQNALRGLSQVQQLLAGGDVLAVEDVELLLRTYPRCRFINGYGPTENTTFSCCYPVPPEAHLADGVPIGFPISHTQVYLLDRYLQPVPVGVVAEIYVGGAGLARGYLERPALSAERFVASPYGTPGTRMYRTGDLGRWRPDGVVEFLGRTDHQVKIRGFRVELGEIEAALREQPSVCEAVVLARGGGTGEKQLVAYVIARGNDPVEPRALREQLSHRLPEYMLPVAYIRLEALPLTPNGKLDRQALPAPTADAYAMRRYEAPRTAGEETLCSLFAELLGLERVGLDDNFFELGGHSLLAGRLVSRVLATLGVNMAIRTLFESPTVRELSPRMREAGSRRPPLKPRERLKTLPTKPA
jgi:amino acid adenylation domain-containing protein